MLPYFIDSHCHLDISKFNRDREEVILHAQEAGVKEMINSGVDLKTNFSTLELAKTHDCIHPTIGLSPMLATNPDKDRVLEVLSQLDEYAPTVIGIGEAGMDYYHCTDEPLRKNREKYLNRSSGLQRTMQNRWLSMAGTPRKKRLQWQAIWTG
nr:TatD family hydrolase [Methanohalophilus profundi]